MADYISQITLPNGDTYDIKDANAASSSHVHGNITNGGLLGIANRLVYTDDNKLINVSGHYTNSTKVAINSTSEPTENLYVNGTVQFNIGTDDGSSLKNFKVYGNSRFVSIGGLGILVYTTSNNTDSTGVLYLQYSGGGMYLGPKLELSTGNNPGFTSSGNLTFASASSKTITLDSASTLYLESGSSASVIFLRASTEVGRFNPSGNFVPKSGATNTIGQSDNKWYAVYATTFNGDLSGNAASASALKNINTNTGSGNRPTSADLTHVTNGGVLHLKVASTDATGHLLHFHWDTSDSWDGQLLIPNNSNNNSMKWRSCSAANTWDDWRTILDSNNSGAGTNNGTTITWNTTYTIAKINGVDIKFKTMAKPTASDVGALANNTVVNKVKTTAKTDNIEYKLLGSAAGTSVTSGSDYEVVYDTDITFNPSTNTITATTFDGNATTATTATNLSAKPTLAAGTSDANKIKITAGGKTSDEFTVPYATVGSTVTITAHTNTTNGNKTYYLPFLTNTSGNLSPKAHSAIYLYETVASNKITKYDFCCGAAAIKGSITLWDGSSNYGNIRTINKGLSNNRTYDLPDASGTIALTDDIDAVKIEILDWT